MKFIIFASRLLNLDHVTYFKIANFSEKWIVEAHTQDDLICYESYGTCESAAHDRMNMLQDLLK